MKKAHETVRMTERLAAELTGSAEIANDLGGRTIWHALLDLETREIEVSFYLGDNPDGTDRRSPYQTFRLAL